jgi:hypothetical protein
MLTELPRLMKSRALTFEPNRAKFRALIELPKLKWSKTDALLHPENFPHAEKELPHLAAARTLKLDPKAMNW